MADQNVATWLITFDDAYEPEDDAKKKTWRPATTEKVYGTVALNADGELEVTEHRRGAKGLLEVATRKSYKVKGIKKWEKVPS